MLKNLRIGTQILIAFTVIAAFAVGITGYVSYDLGRTSLEDESFNKLTAVREMKANQIEDYFQQIADQVVTLSEDRMIIDAMRAFDDSLHEIEGELDLPDEALRDIDAQNERYYQEEYLARLVPNLMRDASITDYWTEETETKILQNLFLAANPFETGSKHLLDNPGDGSTYSQVHEIYHPIIRNYLEHFGYYDIFLVDVDTGGHIAYSVFKEVDFGTSLLTGPYSETNFAKVYNAAREATSNDFVQLVDFEPYHPSYNSPAAFIASPIFDGDEKIGVLIFQMPIDRINKIMTNNQQWSKVGLGDSGETYIVGEDFLLRNQSRFLIEDSTNYFRIIEEIGFPANTIAQIRNLNSTIGLQEVRTQGTEAALRGETGTKILDDYRGVSVLSAYKPLNIHDVNWVIMSEIDETEAFEPIQELRTQMLFGIGLMFVAILAAALLFSRSITKPLATLTDHANALAQGQLDESITVQRKDELGILARNFDTMRQSIKTLIRELESVNAGLEEQVAERTAELEQASERIRTIIETSSDAIITIDSNQNIVLFNPQAEAIFGYPADDVLNQPLTILMPDHIHAQHPREVEKFSKEAVNSRSMDARREIVGRRKDGTVFPGEAGISKMLLDGQEFFTAFFRDITERKEMETKLQEAFAIISQQKERMEGELNIAREIQLSMLPLIFPAFPTRQEIDVHAALESAREVGGDFYDFYFIDDEHFCLVIGDVSGKGAPGALFMAVAKTLIKSRAMDDSSPASILTYVNNELARDNETCMFVTTFLAILNVKTGEFTYTNASHNPPYIKRTNGDLERLDTRHGPIVGGMENMAYQQDSGQLFQNDMILLYTDGVTEAMDADENLFSEKRLTDILTAQVYETPEDLIEATVATVEHFQGEAEQADDITVLALTFKQETVVHDRRLLELSITNEYSQMAVVEEAFEKFVEDHDLPTSLRQKTNVVLDELLNNVISYAYPEGGEHTIDVRFALSGRRMVVTIIDDGIPFNPFGGNPPNITLSMDDREVGGLGIHLVKSVMDEHHYQRQIDKNVVTLVKFIE